MTPAGVVTRDHCPWCGAREKTTLCAHPFDQEPLCSGFRDPVPAPGLTFTVHECARCRTLYQETIRREEESSAYYESWSFQETPLEFTLFYLQELLMIRSHFDRPAGEIKVLDYGMGWGRFCEAARTLGLDACGYDVNRLTREHARSRSVRTLDRLEELEPGSLDVINLEQVLEHVAEPLELVQRLTGYLREGGIMKISVPMRPLGIASTLGRLARVRPDRLARHIEAVWPLSHVNCFNPKALRAVLADRLRPRRIHLNSLILVFSPDLFHRVLGRALYKNYFPRVNYMFFSRR